MERLKSLGYAGFSGGGSPTITDRALPDPKDRIQAYELISDAMAESQHGDYRESTEKLTRVLQTDPDSVPVHYLLGLNYYRMREFSRAAEQLERVLQLSPEYSLAAFQLGLAYARAGDYDHAVQALKRALELDATNFSAAYNLGVAYRAEADDGGGDSGVSSVAEHCAGLCSGPSRFGRNPAVPGAGG